MAPGIKHLGPSMGAIEQAIEWLEHSVYVQCRTVHDGSSFEAVDRCDAEVDVKRDILMQAIGELVDREVELAVKAERRRAAIRAAIRAAVRADAGEAGGDQ